MTKQYFKHPCGLCKLGPTCLCPNPAVYGPPRPTGMQRAIPSGPHVSAMQYRGMNYTDPRVFRMIEADTAAFCAEMQAEVKAGIERRRRSEL